MELALLLSVSGVLLLAAIADPWMAGVWDADALVAVAATPWSWQLPIAATLVVALWLTRRLIRRFGPRLERAWPVGIVALLGVASMTHVWVVVSLPGGAVETRWLGLRTGRHALRTSSEGPCVGSYRREGAHLFFAGGELRAWGPGALMEWGAVDNLLRDLPCPEEAARPPQDAPP